MIDKEYKVTESKRSARNHPNKDNYILIPIIKDGNYFFKSISVYLTDTQDNDPIIGELISKNKRFNKGTIAICLEDYTGGILLIRIEETQQYYKKDEADIKYLKSISKEQWENAIKKNHQKKLSENCKKKK